LPDLEKRDIARSGGDPSISAMLREALRAAKAAKARSIRMKCAPSFNIKRMLQYPLRFPRWSVV
jgi:hypothetical protein